MDEDYRSLQFLIGCACGIALMLTLIVLTGARAPNKFYRDCENLGYFIAGERIVKCSIAGTKDQALELFIEQP